jgi:hypothetical protein
VLGSGREVSNGERGPQAQKQRWQSTV